MDFGIAAILAQDGSTYGAVYALLAVALVLVFSVTRVIFLAQGEFIGFGALTLAALQTNQFPGIIWLLIVLGILTFAADAVSAFQQRRYQRFSAKPLLASGAENLIYPALAFVLAKSIGWQSAPMLLQILFTLALTVPIALMVYRLAYQPIAEASVLVLLIVSVAVHFAMLSTSLLIFGPEGTRTLPFTEWTASIGVLDISGQSLVVIVLSLCVIAMLYLFFGHTLQGKALRATAINRNGARLVGISTRKAGRMSFAVASAIGVLAGTLIGPMSTVQYDTGFVVALKGFVAAIVGGLVSYPLAAAGAFLVGLLESYSSFWNSAYKEVLVFTLIIPVLAWRSFRSPHRDEE